MHFETLSLEHILPQNPSENSEIDRLFSVAERAMLTDKIGNLVLITRRKNSSQGRLDYQDRSLDILKRLSIPAQTLCGF